MLKYSKNNVIISKPWRAINRRLSLESLRRFSRKERDGNEYDVILLGSSIPTLCLGTAISHSLHNQKPENPPRILLLTGKTTPLEHFTSPHPPSNSICLLNRDSREFLRSVDMQYLLNPKYMNTVREMHIDFGGIGDVLRVDPSYIQFSPLKHICNVLGGRGRGGGSGEMPPETPAMPFGQAIQSAHLISALLERIRAFGIINIEEHDGNMGIQEEKKSNVIVSEGEREFIGDVVICGEAHNYPIPPANTKSYQETSFSCTLQVESTPPPYFYQGYYKHSLVNLLPLWGNYLHMNLISPDNLATNTNANISPAQIMDIYEELRGDWPSGRELVTTDPENMGTMGTIGNMGNMGNMDSGIRSNRAWWMQVHNMVKERVIYMGEAAHVVHPHTFNNLNIGITDAALLANLLIKYIYKRYIYIYIYRSNWGAEDLWEEERRFKHEYERYSWANANTIGVLSHIAHETSALHSELLPHLQHKPFAFLRDLTLNIGNKWNPVRGDLGLLSLAAGAFMHPKTYNWII